MSVTALFKEAEELSWIENAYLECAIRLCESLIEDDLERSLHHYRVPLHLTYLVIELYLKSGISLAGQKYKPTHDLDKLQRQYDAAAVGIKLPIPRFLDQFIPRSEDLFSDDPAPTSAWHFERLRYSSDRRGKPFPDLDMADLRRLKKELELLHQSGTRILYLARRRILENQAMSARPTNCCTRRAKTHAREQ